MSKMRNNLIRVGQIVPSSNVTMETEIPAMLRAREEVSPERFSFHSSRMRMKNVTKEELQAMDADSGRCALELSDARMDVLGYACLVAIMSMGNGYHQNAQFNLQKITEENNAAAPVVTSAGALIDGLHALGAKTISFVCPYMDSLARLVVDYIESEGIKVKDYLALEIPDNLEVAAQDPNNLLEHFKKVDTEGIDVLVLSACVQMPSLAAVAKVEKILKIPVTSSSICTTWQMLKSLNLSTYVPEAGELLSGKY
jgi:maleate isomerase